MFTRGVGIGFRRLYKHGRLGLDSKITNFYKCDWHSLGATAEEGNLVDNGKSTENDITIIIDLYYTGRRRRWRPSVISIALYSRYAR